MSTSLKLRRLNAIDDSSSWKYVERASAIATGWPSTVARAWIGPWTLRNTRRWTSCGGERSGGGIRSVTAFEVWNWRSETLSGTHSPL